MKRKRRSSCFGNLVFFLVIATLLATFVGIVHFEYFSIQGQVIETNDPNIQYLYTYQGTNQFGQTEENNEIINKAPQNDGTLYMYTFGLSPVQGQNVYYQRLKITLFWPIYKVLWINYIN